MGVVALVPGALGGNGDAHVAPSFVQPFVGSVLTESTERAGDYTGHGGDGGEEMEDDWIEGRNSQP